MKIVMANDHAAVELKWAIKAYVEELGHEVINLGNDDASDRLDNYAEYGVKAARAVAAHEADCGILICGTGVGISLAANKVHGIRAAVCSEPATARLVKQHNDANILCFGARIVGLELAKDIVRAYLTATFDGGRHADRVAYVMNIEKEEALKEKA